MPFEGSLGAKSALEAGGGILFRFCCYLARVFFLRPVAMRDTADVAGISFSVADLSAFTTNCFRVMP
jgi:hypothetical protein